MFIRRTILGAGPLALLFLIPLAASLFLLLPGLTDSGSFKAALAHPQFLGAAVLTIVTGLASTSLALLLAILIVASTQVRVTQHSGAFLAVPHLALALGLGFLIAPTGLLARALATVVTGWTSPPDWQTVQDPYGFGLILALVLKETPFLVWAMWHVMTQDELRHRFSRETVVARSLGHNARSVFCRVILPQVMSRSLWPLVAVFSYGMTVVDMALVIGPGQPPTLAQLAWTDLNDGEVTTAARGAASTLLLSAGVALLVVSAWLVSRLSKPLFRRWLTAAPGRAAPLPELGPLLWLVWLLIYGLVVAALLLQSVSLFWPFPNLLASSFSLKAWQQMLGDLRPLATTAILALSTASLAVLSCLAWFETQAHKRDLTILVAVTLVLCLPALLLALGLYRVLLHLAWTGTSIGLLLAHLLFVTAYVFVMLQGAYRAYDQRWSQVAHGLAVSKWRYLFHVKWPMLKAPIAAAFSVGFAVSVAQFIPAQLAAAGRFSTLPMEAVTLSAGGNRALIAVYALVLMVLPLLSFQLAARLGRPRWSTA